MNVCRKQDINHSFLTDFHGNLEEEKERKSFGELLLSFKSDSREVLVRGPSYFISKAHSDPKCFNSLPARLTGVWIWTGSRILRSSEFHVQEMEPPC